MARLKTDPKHKAKFSIGVRCSCSCGWQSSMWLGKGAKANAAAEWRDHRAACAEPEVSSGQRAWETAMGMRGYVGSGAHAEDIRDRDNRQPERPLRCTE